MSDRMHSRDELEHQNEAICDVVHQAAFEDSILAIAIDSRLSAAKSLLPASRPQQISYCQPAVTSEFAADSQYNLWMKLGGLFHGSLCLVYGSYLK